MHQSSNHSKFQRMRRRLDLFRQKKEEQSVSHPLRACLPFLCATGVLMTTVVTACLLHPVLSGGRPGAVLGVFPRRGNL